MYGTIKTLAKLLLSVHTSRAAESRSLKEILLVFSSTACHSTVALLQTGTSILHGNILSAHYLSILSFSMSGKCAECTMIARNIEWSVTRRSDDGWRRVKPEHCWSVLRGIFFSGRKFSASLVNGLNDSSKYIICLNEFLYSSYSRNRFSPSMEKNLCWRN